MDNKLTHDPHELNSQEDLFALASTIPEQGKWEFMKIINKLQKKKISVEEATEKVKELFFKYGVYEPGDDTHVG